MPEECASRLSTNLEKAMAPVRYCRVILKLGDILQGDFFSEYVKQRKVLMLSEGRIGADNVFALKNGEHTTADRHEARHMCADTSQAS